MKTLKLLTAALFALALLAIPTTALLAAPVAPPQGMRAHSDAWNEVSFDHNASAHVTFAVTEPSREFWRGGLAENYVRPVAKTNRTVTSVVKPAIRVHSEDWDASIFDRNVNVRIKSSVTDYTEPGKQQGCHANKEHYPSAALALAVPQP